GRAAVLAATAAAALAVALVLLGPRASGWLVFRGRGDAAYAVRELGARLDAEPDPAAVPATFLRCVVDTAYLDGARLRGPGILDVVHGADPRTRDDAVTVLVTYLGGWLADLVVAPRRGETALTARDQQVVARLAVHAAPALHGAVVMADLVVARSELVRAHEEERRRLRHDLHDDVGPALSGLALSAAALARRAADVDPALHALGTELVDDIQGTVERTRALARGLRPAVLDDLGLAAAVRDRVRGLGGDDLTVQVDAPDALPLPAAVDLAALRIVQEAVTNVHRHAGARACVVALRVDGGALHVVVDDDGSGLPEPLRPGVGLASIRDRAAELGGGVRLGRSDLGGTRLAVRLPVGVAT
ncbi:sensor histidine kinase, partial [Angustibacter speluncae]